MSRSPAFAPLLSAGAFVLALAAPACAAPKPVFDEAETEAIGEIVRAYLLEHPEVLEEVVAALQERRFADQMAEEEAIVAAARSQIPQLSAKIYNDARDPSIGPADAPLTIVEFFDYNCPFCQRGSAWLQETLAAHPGKIRVVFKEAATFVDNETSQFAAKMGIAAQAQGKYEAFHFGLMEAEGQRSIQQVRQMARAAGVDVSKAETVIGAPETQTQIDDARALMDQLGTRGVPYWIVNGEPVSGADIARLEELVTAGLGETGG